MGIIGPMNLRKHIVLSEEQVEYLELLDRLTVSEHVRRAIDEYIDRLRGLNVSASQSRKEGK